MEWSFSCVRCKDLGINTEKVYGNCLLWYNSYMQNKFTVQKSFGTTSTGKERVVWNVMQGEFVVDTFNKRYIAKYYAEKWSKE